MFKQLFGRDNPSGCDFAPFSLCDMRKWSCFRFPVENIGVQVIHCRFNGTICFRGAFMIYRIISFVVIALVTFPIWKITTRGFQDPKLFFALICCAILTPLLLFRKREESVERRSAAPGIFLIYVLFTMSYWVFTPYTYTGTQQLAMFALSQLSFLLGTAFYQRPELLTVVSKSFVTVAGIASLIALLEFLGVIENFDKSPYFPVHLSGHVAHKNSLGFMLMAAVFIAIPLLKGKRFRVYYAANLLLILTALLLLDSRSSLLFTFAGLALSAFPLSKRYGLFRTQNQRIALYAALFILSLIPLLVWDESIWSRFVQLFQSGGKSFRAGIYTAQWHMFLEKPFFGHGMGSFVHRATEYWPTAFRESNSFSYSIQNGHNEYLEILCQFGIVGAALHFFFWFGAVVNGIGELRKKWDLFTFQMLAALVVMMLHASVSVASRRMPCAFLFWFIMGYFWRNQFTLFFASLRVREVKLVRTLVVMSSLCCVGLFSKLLVSDYLYNKSVKDKKVDEKSLELLQAALRIEPKSHWVLSQLAHIAVEIKNYEDALAFSQTLLETAPNIHPLYYAYRGRAYYEQGILDSALMSIEMELKYHRKYLNAIEAKATILSRLGREEELLELQSSLGDPKILPDSLTSSEIENGFENALGSLRRKAAGEHLFLGYKNYKTLEHKRALLRNKQLRNILGLTCVEKSE